MLNKNGDEIMSGADSVVVELDMEAKQLEQIMDLAEKHGKAVYAVISNMSLAMERRNLLQRTGCIVCNKQEAGLFFSEDYRSDSIGEMHKILTARIRLANIPCMVVTLGEQGAVYAQLGGESGCCPPGQVDVVDTAGAGDAFFSGVAAGLTYGKTLSQSCEIGTRLAASVIATGDSVCPRFRPEEFGLQR